MQGRSQTAVQQPSRQHDSGDERDQTEDSPQQETQQLACLIRRNADGGTHSGPRIRSNGGPPPAPTLKLVRITIEWTYR